MTIRGWTQGEATGEGAHGVTIRGWTLGADPGREGSNPEGRGTQGRTEGVQEPRGGGTQRGNPGGQPRNEDTWGGEARERHPGQKLVLTLPAEFGNILVTVW